MTSSDDNDKTRIQPKPGSDARPAAADSADQDRTRIALTPEQLAERQMQEELRRLAAKRKAQELEKRLAELKATESRSENSANDEGRTRIAPQKSAAASESEKTRIQARQNPAASLPLDADPQRTVIKTRDEATRSAAVHSPEKSPDKTVFNRPVKPSVETSSTPRSSVPRPDSTGPSDPTKINEFAPEIKTLPPLQTGAASYRGTNSDGVKDMLKGRFAFEKVLGAGGMGVVYKARDQLKVEAHDRDPYVAIKVLGDEFRSHPEAFIALQRESRKTQRIAHPNIVNVYDFDRDGDTVFMTMEYMEGKPLDKLISQYKATGLPEDDAWQILQGICAALIYAHEQSIIHSDFKPGNIFVTEKGVAKVFDFGIARAVAKAEKLEESIDDKTVFDAGNLGALTPAYASLEMLEGKAPDVRDDIYALGCIAYEMFTGNHPFNRVHANEAMKQKLKPKRIANISKRQWKVIERALAFRREERISSVEEFWHELTRKQGAGVWIGVGTAVLMLVISFLVYQNYFAPKEPGISADDIRSEVERDLRIKQYKREITELLIAREFTANWEEKIWQAYEAISEILGANDPWILEQKEVIGRAYLAQVAVFLEAENIARARQILVNAPRFVADANLLAELAKQIDQAEALIAKRREEERQKQAQKQIEVVQQQAASVEQAKAQKQRTEAFDVALDTVNQQLLCRSTMNMRDIEVAIDKLRSLDQKRYQSEEKNMVTKLAACITNIGQTFPERGEEFKKRAERIFVNNSTIANIKIEPKDPCDLALAGLGARGERALCRDPLKREGEDLGRGPALVVIPAKGSIKAFAISKFEITDEEIGRYCSHTKECSISATANKLPVTNVDIGTIKKYIVWLNRMSKRVYRLPTKTEWAYAARANSDKLDSNRNCRLDSRGIKKGGVLIRASTGQQNPWGLVNFLGNARELVVVSDGFAAMGGSYETNIEECIVSKSEAHDGQPDPYTGFRLLREIENK